MTNRIDDNNYPLAFKISNGTPSQDFKLNLQGEEVIQVEARQMYSHQKEAVTTEGRGGDVWRLPSDEGLHLNGTDLAPFPLGFFNAGVQGDLFHLFHQVAKHENVALDSIQMELSNHYWLTGSFILGTGVGHAEPTHIKIQVESSAPKATVNAIVQRAIQLSPAIHYLKASLKNSFALYINGRRRPTVGLLECSSDAVDPFLSHSKAPSPLSTESNTDLLVKLTTKQEGEVKPAPKTIDGKMLRNILGKGSWQKGDPYANITTWLDLAGTTHFAYKADVGGHQIAPSGLSLVSSGIAFCFMTQLARYIEGMKMNIHGVRLVQINAYNMMNGSGNAAPIQTHLFLNGEAPEETHTKLLEISERTCYLHAAASTANEPVIEIV
jgi:uncharacterized OsmC-like protein